VRTGARNRIARVPDRFPAAQQAQAFAGSGEPRQAMTRADVDQPTYRIELAVEA
jgi:hypothetical protein